MFQQSTMGAPINYWFGSINIPSVESSANNYNDYDDKPIARDSNGNVFTIYNYTYISGGVTWGFIQKVNRVGAVLWTRTFTNSYWQPKQITVDSSGNVYVSGKTANASPNIFVMKFNNDGAPQWGETITITSGTYSYPIGLCVSSSGNTVFLSFEFYTGSAFRSGIMSLSAADGSLNWKINTTTNGIRYNDITTDSSDNVYVCGQTTANEGILLKFNSSGTQQWGVGASNIVFNCVATYAGTHIIAAGNDNTDKGYWVQVSMAAGTVAWQRTYQNNNSTPVGIRDIHVDSNSVIYMSGWTQVPTSIAAGLVVRISGSNGYTSGSSTVPIVFHQDNGSNDGYFYGITGSNTQDLGINSYGDITMLGLNGSPGGGINSSPFLVKVSADWTNNTSTTITYPYNGLNFKLTDAPAFTMAVASASYSSGFTYTWDTPSTSITTNNTWTNSVTGVDLTMTPLSFDPSKLS